MNANTSTAAPVELSLVEIDPPLEQPPHVTTRGPISGPTTVERTESEQRAPDGDRFLAEAAREYRNGHIDQPLWVRAIDRADGDETTALEAYLQARAIALRLAMREKRSGASARRNRAPYGADPSDDDVEDRPRGARSEPRRSEHHDGNPLRKRLTIGAAMVVCVAASAWWMTAQRARDSAPPPVATAAAPAGNLSRPTPEAGNGKSAATDAVAPAGTDDQARELEAKVQQLMSAGNWNVLILHATEWTRKAPTNADAWKLLSIGYSKLRQFNDASDAANRAIELAPTDYSMWRNLGQIELAAKEPQAALRAFDRAIELNEQDVESLVLAGTTNAQLGRLPQARIAFDKAMALSPGNADALCGQVLLAQKQGKPKEAEAIARQLKATDTVCSDLADPGIAAAATPSTATYRSVPVRGR
jgi:Flp pilus assembly protein TadD